MSIIFKHTDSDGDEASVASSRDGNLSISCGDGYWSSNCVILGEAEAAQLRNSLTSWLPARHRPELDQSDRITALEAHIAELVTADANGKISDLSIELHIAKRSHDVWKERCIKAEELAGTISGELNDAETARLRTELAEGVKHVQRLTADNGRQREFIESRGRRITKQREQLDAIKAILDGDES